MSNTKLLNFKYILKMKKIWVFIISFLAIMACELIQNANDSEKAKQWLITSIEENFNKTSSMNGITTKEYEAYKSDATNVDFDILTEKEFENKWKHKFNIKYAGVGSGFLISAQDWDNIKVSYCKLSNQKTNNGYWYICTITDPLSKTNYYRDIKVIYSDNSFLIADVKEYN